MGESNTTRGPRRLDQPDRSAVNIYKSSSMLSVKGMNPNEASSAALPLPPELGINQVGKSDKVSNSRS